MKPKPEQDHPQPGEKRDKDEISRAVALARVERPAYNHLYDFLEALLIAGAEIRGRVHIEIPSITRSLAKSKWENGSPLLNRRDFPVDVSAAEDFLAVIEKAIPVTNRQLAHACESLRHSIAIDSRRRKVRHGLLHEMGPWADWLEVDSTMGPTSLFFLAMSAVRPSLELTARALLQAHRLPPSWKNGYCPVCGSLPSLLYIHGEGARRGFCSWCTTRWDLNRLQCPFCENRRHESLGYIGIEEEPQNRIAYCEICRFYFKQIDLRDLDYAPCLPLEEWITFHLDLLARKAGWRQPPSPASAV